MISIAVILVNYGQAQATLACIHSLWAQQLPKNCQLLPVVVDNASPDNSIAQLEAFLQENPQAFLLVKTTQNTGFSGGNNAGIQAILPKNPDYIWLLNNDTQVCPDTLSQLLACSQKHPNSLIGPVLRYPNGQFQQVGIRVNTWTGSLKGYPEPTQNTLPYVVDSLSGASMWFSRKLFEQLGPMPEALFLYVEDVAYCLKARQLGFTCVVCPSATVAHDMGTTTNAQTQRRAYYYQRNRLWVLWRAAYWWQKPIFALYTLYRLLRMALKGPKAVGAFWRSCYDAMCSRLGPKL